MMVTEFTEKPLDLDETKEIQDKLKIKIPPKYGIRNQIIWKPIMTQQIPVTITDKNGNEKIELQNNREINRVIIEEKLDLVEFIWIKKTLPNGVTSCLPELYDKTFTIPVVEDDGVYLYHQPIWKISEIAQKLIKLREERKKKSPVGQKLNANNHLILELFDVTNKCKKNYNKYQYPDYAKSERERNDLDMEREQWFKEGIFEDAKRLSQLFRQFPDSDQPLFDDYLEIVTNLLELKKAKHDPQTKARKLALSYEMILIAQKNIPNRVQFVREEVENPDFGKLSEKDA